MAKQRNTKKNIIKSDGRSMRFSRKKVQTSLQRAGASEALAREISVEVEEHLHKGMSTGDIYDIAFRLLKHKKERPIAARYSLKRAIQALGPTGFPFERFIGELLKRHGYKVEIGKTVQGYCVPHEVDVEAVKGDKHIFVECKFHNQLHTQTDVKVPLYIQSRFKDIEKEIVNEGDTHTMHFPWIVTNTGFTKSAIAYASCMGMVLIGWRYPKGRGIERLVEDIGLHPVTALTTLNKQQKTALLKRNIVLCIDVTAYQLKKIGVSKEKIESVLKEIKGICRNTVEKA